MEIAVRPVPLGTLLVDHGLVCDRDGARKPDSRAQIGNDVEFLEAWYVGRIDEARMSDVMHGAGAPQPTHDLHGIENIAHGGMADAQWTLTPRPSVSALTIQCTTSGSRRKDWHTTERPASSGL